jgi:hypothetical protein
VTGDGQRFLMPVSEAPSSSAGGVAQPKRVRVIVNWISELKARFGN